ncbi:MAG TPA: LysR substrate-binding domain-containing protein, partial [Polyangiaceae bacterium]|nr:LysR substrate-binding domain-containing protein [Polyangiaceae bacterium]
DPITHRLDAIVSVNVPRDSTLVSTHLGTDIEIIVGSPALASRWQAATQPKDLIDAPWVAHPAVADAARHPFRDENGVLQRFTPKGIRILANTSDAIRSLVVGGAGLAVVPAQMVLEDMRSGRMLRLLPNWRRRSVRFHVCVTSRSHAPARVSLFVEELRALFKLTGFEAEYTGAAPRHALRHTEQ